MQNKVEGIRTRLLQWGQANVISYPWRYRDSLYDVLVAEFMLHRTQAYQVVPVYTTFLDRWPDLRSFSSSNAELAVETLSPLGLNWRIQSMINALMQIWERFDKVPSDIASLKSIYGIGDYIAAATVCFALQKPVTLIDTNTVRVTGRVYGLDLTGEARRSKAMIEAISKSYDPQKPRDYYYAMIDLAHSICTPNRPECRICPLSESLCEYSANV